MASSISSSRDGGEADRPVVPWVLLLALFEDWSDKICKQLEGLPLLFAGTAQPAMKQQLNCCELQADALKIPENEAILL